MIRLRRLVPATARQGKQKASGFAKRSMKNIATPDKKRKEKREKMGLAIWSLIGRMRGLKETPKKTEREYLMRS